MSKHAILEYMQLHNAQFQCEYCAERKIEKRPGELSRNDSLNSLYLRKAISDLDIKNQRYLSSANKAHIGFQKLQNLATDRSEKASLYTVLGFTLTPFTVGYSLLTAFLYRRLRQAKKKIEQYEKEKEDAKTIETATKIGKAVIGF